MYFFEVGPPLCCAHQLPKRRTRFAVQNLKQTKDKLESWEGKKNKELVASVSGNRSNWTAKAFKRKFWKFSFSLCNTQHIFAIPPDTIHSGAAPTGRTNSSSICSSQNQPDFNTTCNEQKASSLTFRNLVLCFRSFSVSFLFFFSGDFSSGSVGIVFTSQILEAFPFCLLLSWGV